MNASSIVPDVMNLFNSYFEKALELMKKAITPPKRRVDYHDDVRPALFSY